jgi:hypothetical protein
MMALLAKALADVTTTGAAERFAQVGPKIGITSRVSLAATVAIHATLFFLLLWLGFHAPPVVPSRDEVCSGKPAPSTAAKHIAREIHH